MGYSPWGGKESDTTERLHLYSHFGLLRSQKRVRVVGSQPTWGMVIKQARPGHTARSLSRKLKPREVGKLLLSKWDQNCRLSGSNDPVLFAFILWRHSVSARQTSNFMLDFLFFFFLFLFCVSFSVCLIFIYVWLSEKPMLLHQSLYNSGPQPFWHQGLVSWKAIFPWTWGWGMVLGWFKHITFIVHFISIIITSIPAQIIRH